ncbi:hypothetical protein L798_01273 [Zootermopsis nevadensis]|uniref:Uncharacterized protein n=1 Tax=Zootermopsis nevadensis TaxID=136037 RepID=A0A067QU29_ZOONE|nr:hypothetical protein L798_01273 [Zootermopsis nevadensis]
MNRVICQKGMVCEEWKKIKLSNTFLSVNFLVMCSVVKSWWYFIGVYCMRPAAIPSTKLLVTDSFQLTKFQRPKTLERSIIYLYPLADTSLQNLPLPLIRLAAHAPYALVMHLQQEAVAHISWMWRTNFLFIATQCGS